ncbi:hypothetical protein [Prevotella koreensis]
MTPPRFNYFFSRTKYSLIAPLGSARRRFRSKAKKERSSLNAQRSARLRQETLSKQSEERTLITHRSTLNAPLGSARRRFQSEAKKERSSLNYIFIPPSTCIT